MKKIDCNILIVEDNQMMRKMLESMLIDLGYHTYCTAADGASAWERIQQGDVDIVLSDYLMPAMNGLELLRLIRQSKLFYNMPFVMITGVDRRADLMRSIQAEVDHYIIKPPNLVQLGELLDNLRAHLKKPTPFSAQMNRGKFHFLNGEPAKALRHFEDARQARPESPLPYYYLGMAHQQLNQGEKAEENLRKSLDLEGEFVSSLLALADIYEGRNDYDKLAACYARVEEILPDSFDIQIGLARASTRAGHFERAANHLGIAQKLARQNADHIQEVLECYIEAGLLDEADLLFGRKVQDDDAEKTILFLNRLGLRARSLKEFEKAKLYYLSCLKLDPQHKIVNYNLAALLVLQKEYVAAESYLKRLLRLHPDFEEARVLMNAIHRKSSGKGNHRTGK